MSENKCPCCGGKIELDCYDGVFGEEAVFDCIPCGITITGRHRFDRIAAAMELLKISEAARTDVANWNSDGSDI